MAGFLAGFLAGILAGSAVAVAAFMTFALLVPAHYPRGGSATRPPEAPPDAPLAAPAPLPPEPRDDAEPPHGTPDDAGDAHQTAPGAAGAGR